MNNEAKVLATVGGKPITEMDVEMMLMQMGQRASAYNNPQGRAMVLEQLINKALLVLDATRNLYERDAEFKAELARVKEDLLANYAVEKAVRDVRITDADVEAYYIPATKMASDEGLSGLANMIMHLFLYLRLKV